MRVMGNRWKHSRIREDNQSGDTWGAVKSPEMTGDLPFKIKQEITRQMAKPHCGVMHLRTVPEYVPIYFPKPFHTTKPSKITFFNMFELIWYQISMWYALTNCSQMAYAAETEKSEVSFYNKYM